LGSRSSFATMNGALRKQHWTSALIRWQQVLITTARDE
jgi:hypothetical protein